jgi:hypothetical protein
MRDKILIILNTPYHSETALSLYGSLDLLNFEPYIYTIYSEKDYGLLDLCDKYNINYIKEYSPDLRINFKKAFLITPINGSKDQKNQNSPCEPEGYKNIIIKDFIENMILLLHRPSINEKFITYAKEYLFKNPKFVGLSPFSQQIGLNYILLSENPIANSFPIKHHLTDNSKVRFTILGRFQWGYRDFQLLNKFLSQNIFVKRDYEIVILGETADNMKNHIDDSNRIIYKSDLNEIDFYEQIYKTDFILNLLSSTHIRGYFTDCTSSNYNHIFSFRKPAINCKLSNLIYPFPSFLYSSEAEFPIAFSKAVNINENEYEKMIKNFDIVKENIRLHNKYVIENLIYK